MRHTIEASFGFIALGAPIVIALILVAVTENRHGRSRLVIVDGRVRRRR